ncbi:hypothetical protein [Streptomyces xanthochromogenes]|uniref:hypothetical protein n=1 Tax=Streptomyces xanthochromogenes TaxID=67384 RepID=UPI001676157B|nr:hypothetical protein [Streptomyces xanthochromogenes]
MVHLPSPGTHRTGREYELGYARRALTTSWLRIDAQFALRIGAQPALRGVGYHVRTHR